MPRFSLVVPTLRRPDTLRHALATAAAQDFADFEVVVQNNGADHDVERVVAGFADDRIRLFKTPHVLPMSENWEIALGHARGDYIAFIGDDDGLLPDACSVAQRIIAMTGTEIVSWLPFLYYWPQYADPGRRNRLIANVDAAFRLTHVDSLGTLRQVFRWQIDYSLLPMIYNSFVARRVVERTRARAGRYFVGRSPDVVSGIVNAAMSRDFIRLTRPLSVTGISRHSTGHNNFFHRLANRQDPDFSRDFGQFELDHRLAGATNLQAMIANDLLAIQRLRIADDRSLAMDFTGLVRAMAGAINDIAGAYDTNLASIRAIAARNRVDLSGIAIPSRAGGMPALKVGTTATGRHAQHHVIDGDAAGLATIADAVRLAHPMIPKIDALDRRPIEERAGDPGLEVPPDGLLTFRSQGNGIAALCDGWSEPEAWGTWSNASPCMLRIVAPRRRPAPCTLALACRSFLYGADDRMTVSCGSVGHPLGRWVFADGSARQELQIAVPASAWSEDGTLSLMFEVNPMRSPAQFGISADTRLLGIGLEWLRVVMNESPGN